MQVKQTLSGDTGRERGPISAGTVLQSVRRKRKGKGRERERERGRGRGRGQEEEEEEQEDEEGEEERVRKRERGKGEREWEQEADKQEEGQWGRGRQAGTQIATNDLIIMRMLCGSYAGSGGVVFDRAWGSGWRSNELSNQSSHHIL